MFAGHETVAKTVSFFTPFDLRFILTSVVVDACPLGARKEATCSRETSSGDHENARKNQGQG